MTRRRRPLRRDPRAGSPGPGGAGPVTAPTPRAVRSFGTDLVIRNLATGSERTLPDVGEFSLTRDGKLLAYTVASRKGEANGVFAIDPTSLTSPVAVKA